MAEPKKPTHKERLQEITAGIEQGIKELFESGRYEAYLRTMSRFHRYSVNNQMLIHLQKPDAILVAGFNKWRDQFERHVKKGEKSIKIIAPTPFKKRIEEKKLDPDTKLPVLDRDGKEVMEEKEVEIPMFRPVSVFDVSQTEGKPLPQLAADLHGDVRQYEVFMEALRRSSPVPVAFEMMQGSDGYFRSDEQRIAIRAGMSEVQTVSAAVHEIAHAKLHNYEQERQEAARGDDTRKPPAPKDRATEEVEAESVSYAVCQYYGIQTGENSFGYIAGWSKGKELPELRASLETINKTASSLITDIDRHFRDICKERGIDLSALEQASPELAAPVEDTPERMRGLVIQDAPAEGQANDPAQPGQEQWNEPATADNAPEHPGIPSDNVSAYLPERTLDEYPMPDPTLTVGDLEKCGYLDGDMLPLSRERALELYEQDLTIYTIAEGGEASMAFDREDIETHGGLLAVPREDWEDTPDFAAAVEDRLNRQEEREAAFLQSPRDAFAIYQLKEGDELRDIRFEPLSWLESKGREVERANYDLVYTAPITEPGKTGAVLDGLWYRFNNEHPADYHRPSLSVSDIVAIKQDGVVTCHYCDSIGFVELPGFLPADNPLKNAEMAMEDDYGMIDGIINNGPKQPTVAELEAQVKAGQQISLLDLARATHQGHQKQSVMERLKQQSPQPEKDKNAPKKSAERAL